MAMKIGLVRHYKVKLEYPKQRFVSAADVADWFHAYDHTDVELQAPDLGGVEWDACYSSDLIRAARTARHLYGEEVIETDCLRELALPMLSSEVKLPFLWWAVIVKLKQLADRDSRRDIATARERFGAFLDGTVLRQERNVLLVSHSSFMREMRKELVRRGFRGPNFGHAANGQLIVFER